MTLRSNIIFDPDTSIEVFMDNVQEVQGQHSREIVTYQESQTFAVDTVARYRFPSTTQYIGTIQKVTEADDIYNVSYSQDDGSAGGTPAGRTVDQKRAIDLYAYHENISGISFNKAVNQGTFIGDVTFEIYETVTETGDITGSALASKTLTNAEYLALSISEWHFIDLPCTLDTSKYYALVINPTTSDDSNYINVNSAGYSGNVRDRLYNGAVWSNSTRMSAVKLHFAAPSIIENKRKMIYLNSYADKTIVVDGGNHNAIYGNVENLRMANRNTIVCDIEFTAKAKGGVTGQFYDSDDCTSTGVRTADSDAANGYADVLDASGEKIYFDLTQNDYELPDGDYKIFVRVKDTAQVADDVKLEVYNTTDASSVASDTFTATIGYTYFVLEFTTDSTEDGDSIRFSCEKATATANSISVDFIGFVKV